MALRVTALIKLAKNMRITFPILDLLNKQLNTARGNPLAAAARKKALTQSVQGCCSQIALTPGVRKPGKVWIGIEWHYSNDSIDPIDNLPASLKCTLDAMVKERILKDDSSRIIQFPIFHTRTIDHSHTVTLNIFESYTDYKRWIIAQLP